MAQGGIALWRRWIPVGRLWGNKSQHLSRCWPPSQPPVKLLAQDGRLPAAILPAMMVKDMDLLSKKCKPPINSFFQKFTKLWCLFTKNRKATKTFILRNFHNSILIKSKIKWMANKSEWISADAHLQPLSGGGGDIGTELFWSAENLPRVVLIRGSLLGS